MTPAPSSATAPFVDVVLIALVSALGVVVAAYVFLPDFELALKALVVQAAQALGLW